MSKYDERDPIYHDVQGEKAEAAILRRFLTWLKKQEPYYRRYFCKHGSYVGFRGALAFMCEGCKGD